MMGELLGFLISLSCLLHFPGDATSLNSAAGRSAAESKGELTKKVTALFQQKYSKYVSRTYSKGVVHPKMTVNIVKLYHQYV